MRSIKFELVNRNNSSLFGSPPFGAVVLCSSPVVVVVVSVPTAVVLIFSRLSSSLELSSDSTFAVIPSSSMSSVRATGFDFFVVSMPLKFVDFVFRTGSSGRVIGVDDEFVEPLGPLPLAIDVFREFDVNNGDA